MMKRQEKRNKCGKYDKNVLFYVDEICKKPIWRK